ncbi:paired amphipathic helix protein Sin3a isoform X1 [Tachysurus ichikawai]
MMRGATSIAFTLYLHLLVPLAQSSGGHGHSDGPAVHAGAHHHGPVVQPTDAVVGQGHSHTPPASAPTPGQSSKGLRFDFSPYADFTELFLHTQMYFNC